MTETIITTTAANGVERVQVVTSKKVFEHAAGYSHIRVVLTNLDTRETRLVFSHDRRLSPKTVSDRVVNAIRKRQIVVGGGSPDFFYDFARAVKSKTPARS